MKEEIKEILDGFKEILDNPTTTDECYDGRIIEVDRSYDLDLDEIKLLLDYITNLQEENVRFREIICFNEDYKSRIDKAIEKLKYYKAKPYSEYDSDDVIVDLDWILQGEDTKESEVN